MLENSTPILAIGGLVLVLAILAWSIANRYRVAKPNEAFIITGRRGKTSGDLSGQKTVTGGGVFVWPFIQQLTVLDMSSRRIQIQVMGAPSSQGIALNVVGMATVKVHNEDESIRAAAQRFGGQQPEIDNFVTDQLSGALRAIVGNMTVEDVIRNREAFAQQVLESVTSGLAAQGLSLDAFTIQEVSDHGDGRYILDMGRPAAAVIRRDAEIAEAENLRLAAEKRISAETEIANYNRDLALRQAEIAAETDRARAQSSAAGPLEEAAQRQTILAAQEQVAARQADLTEKELDTTVRRPADASRYRAEQEAEAARITTVKAAEAAKSRALLDAEGQLALRKAAAEAIQLEGAAEAAAILAKGEAEATALDKKADAMAKFGNAAVVSTIVDQLPAIARELAAPMGNIDQLTVISTDGAGALPKQVAAGFVELGQMLKDTTGLDLTALVTDLAGKSPKVSP